MHQTDTIVAQATPMGIGALAVIRMSGERARTIIHACTGRWLEARRATWVRLKDPQGKLVDEAIVTYYAAPASYTGEDVVEVSCHGGRLVTQKAIELLMASGARPAEPGEFSQRAFLNRKMDLTQAEGIMDIIHAGSELALRAAQNQLHGAISAQVGQAADELLSVAAHVSAYIDFPEEDISPDTSGKLLDRLGKVASSLAALMATADEGRYLREGVRTAIVGAPNVGKSSLLNKLLGYDRALVSDTAGTTRDTIEESVVFGGMQLRLIDTAGLHESDDTLERAGMERSRRASAEADLILEVADSTQPPVPLTWQDTGAKRLLLLNKCDMPAHPAWEGHQAIRLSCFTGEGIPALEQAIISLFLHQTGESDTLTAINTRHRYALQKALNALEAARQSLLAGDSPELTDIELREALDALGTITGRIDADDILTRVFSTFCLGK